MFSSKLTHVIISCELMKKIFFEILTFFDFLTIFTYNIFSLLKIAVNNNSAIFTNVTFEKLLGLTKQPGIYPFRQLATYVDFWSTFVDLKLYSCNKSNFHYIPHIFRNNVHLCCMNTISSQRMLTKSQQLLTKNQHMLQVDEKDIFLVVW